MQELIEFEPVNCEFGWECQVFAPYFRKISRDYKKSVVTSYLGMNALYNDFAEFKESNIRGRSLNFKKMYKVKGEFYKYGIPEHKYDIVIHARGIRRKDSINYKNWLNLVKELKDFNVAVVGTKEDKLIENCSDERNIELQSLMNLLAGSKVIIGASSGVMHLASSCGCSQVVWGDSKTRFNETLEKRYKETWNYFGSKVEYIYADDWQPAVDEVINKVRKLI